MINRRFQDFDQLMADDAQKEKDIIEITFLGETVKINTDIDIRVALKMERKSREVIISENEDSMVDYLLWVLRELVGKETYENWKEKGATDTQLFSIASWVSQQLTEIAEAKNKEQETDPNALNPVE